MRARPAVAYPAMSTVLSTLAEYARANPRSQAEHERALRLFPSGLTHDARRQDPFPPCVTRAEGAYKWDVDGHRIVDYVTGHGALVAGHSHPAVVEAMRRQAGLGLHLGASSALQADWAERIVALVPSAERVRFTSSGTEATLLAVRVARGFTRRNRVLKLAGHFHGWHDDAMPGVALPVDAAAPLGSPPNPDLGVVDPFAEGALERELERGDVACVILEPTGAAWGAVPLPPERVASIAAAARASGTLVVFDEVVTGFRWSPGGAQAVIGVTPDLTSLAKVVAGGLAGGALDGACGRDGGARVPRRRAQGRAPRHAQRAPARGGGRHRDARPARRRQPPGGREHRGRRAPRGALCGLRAALDARLRLRPGLHLLPHLRRAHGAIR